VAILAAAADPRIRALDVIEPCGDWPKLAARLAPNSGGRSAPLLGLRDSLVGRGDDGTLLWRGGRLRPPDCRSLDP
jgi:hypothetical protein